MCLIGYWNREENEYMSEYTRDDLTNGSMDRRDLIDTIMELQEEVNELQEYNKIYLGMVDMYKCAVENDIEVKIGNGYPWVKGGQLLSDWYQEYLKRSEIK